MDNAYSKKNDSKWFFFTGLFIAFDYTRLYEIVHLDLLRPMMLIMLVLIYYLWSSGKFKQSWCKQTKFMWYFILILMVLVPFAKNNMIAYKTMVAQVLYMPFVLSIIICVDSMQRLRKFMLLCICLEIYVAVYAFRHSGRGPGNYFVDENDLSLYINMWLPFCYFLFFGDRKVKNKIIYCSGLIIGLLSVVVSFSRGGFVGLLAMTATVWFFSKKKIFSLVVIGLMVLMLVSFGNDTYWEEMSTITDVENSTADERLLSWGAAWRMFLDQPLGVGGNNFQYLFPEYQSSEHGRSMWGRVAHSLWFTLIPETGVFGIIFYLLLLYTNFKDIFFIKNIRAHDENEDVDYLNNLGIAFIASFAGYFASASFISVLYYAHYWYLTGIIVAVVNIARSTEKNNPQDCYFA